MKRLFEAIRDSASRDTSHFEEHFEIPLYRGTSATGFVPFKYRDGPRDTLFAVHNQVNEEAKKKIGQPLRSLAFVSRDMNEVYKYGTPKEVKVVGDDYQIFYNPEYRDLTIDLSVQIHEIEGVIENAFRQAVDDHLNDPDSAHDYLDNGSIALAVVSHFNESSYKTYEDAIHAMVDDLSSKMEEAIQTPSTLSDNVKEILESDIRIINEDIKDYVNGIKEIHSDDDITDERAEIMIYAPQGFVLT